MKFEHLEVYNFIGALRGMRNPLESWSKSDSHESIYNVFMSYPTKEELLPSQKIGYIGNDIRLIEIGANDLALAKKLILAGSDHSKFMRQIFVSVDITAPLYWYKEFDTYKVGTVANSTSTMHKLATTPIALNCFETGDYESVIFDKDGNYIWEFETLQEELIETLEMMRLAYLETKDKRIWKEIIRWLPESWLQTRTITMSYENLRSMYFARKNHKLTEWSVAFIEWIKLLPYSKELIMFEKESE